MSATSVGWVGDEVPRLDAMRLTDQRRGRPRRWRAADDRRPTRRRARPSPGPSRAAPAGRARSPGPGPTSGTPVTRPDGRKEARRGAGCARGSRRGPASPRCRRRAWPGCAGRRPMRLGEPIDSARATEGADRLVQSALHPLHRVVDVPRIGRAPRPPADRAGRDRRRGSRRSAARARRPPRSSVTVPQPEHEGIGVAARQPVPLDEQVLHGACGRAALEQQRGIRLRIGDGAGGPVGAADEQGALAAHLDLGPKLVRPAAREARADSARAPW